MGENVILIGMPGAGKSTVGVVLAKTLGYDFLDSDLVLCRESGRTLQEILDRDGPEAFLRLEEAVVCALRPRRTVLATGGSVPMSDRAMEHLKALGTVVYLQVPLEELRTRLTDLTTRGIAFGPGESLDTLYARRTPIYEGWADVTVSEAEGQRGIEPLARQVAGALRPYLRDG